MLRDHILSSLPQHFGSSEQSFPLLGEGRRPWQRNTAGASCCALGWSTSSGWEIVFGLLRTREQFSDREHHFTSWGEPICRGVWHQSIPSPSRVMLSFSPPVPTPSAGIFPLPSVSNLQKVPTLSSGSFHFTRPCQALGARPSCVSQSSSTDHDSSLLCPAWFPTSCLCFECFAADPGRSKPKSQLP